MTVAQITVERDGGVMWLTLNRPDQANALTLPLAQEFCAAIAQAEADPDCHVLILQGAGRFFCAGGDVAGMASSDDPATFLHTLAEQMHDGLLALARSRLVTIAAVHGPAAGAGLGLVLNADFVLASPSASFLTAYAGVGLTPDCGVSYLLPQMIGPRRAMEMAVGGRVVTAVEALNWGLVTEVVPQAELRIRARRLGARIAGGAAHVLGPTKRLLTAARLTAYADHLADEAETISTMITAPGTHDLLVRFAERRRAT